MVGFTPVEPTHGRLFREKPKPTMGRLYRWVGSTIFRMASTPPFDGKAFVRGLSTAPGVYRMYAADGSVLYVGKAGALKKRVASYFSGSPKTARTMAMLAQVARMEVTVTRTETEALLL